MELLELKVYYLNFKTHQVDLPLICASKKIKINETEDIVETIQNKA